MKQVKTFKAQNGEEITLRPGEVLDSCGILDTIRSTALERSYILMDHYGKKIESEKQYISSLDRSKNLLMVAVAGDSVVGCLAALQADAGRWESTAHILHVGLHLKESYRGIGIGSEMLAYAEAWARERGFRKLEASIFTGNKRSLRLFNRAGFAEEGIRKIRVRVDKNYLDEVLVGKILT
jgi:RimJ/RimL family protein N-acetyltransferase